MHYKTGEPEPSLRRVDGGHFKIMELTVEDIETYITEYRARLQVAREKLAALPEGYLPYQDHKAREKQRRDLQGEIDHVQGLIGYAFEGVKIRQDHVES